MATRTSHSALVAVLATAVGSLIGAALFPLGLDAVDAIDLPDFFRGDGVEGVVLGFFYMLVFFALLAMVLVVVAVVLVAGGAGIMLRLVDADRIAETLAGGIVVMFVGGLIVGSLGLEVPAGLGLPVAFVGSRLVVEATR